MPDEYDDASPAPLGHPDYRGTKGAPSEGRRVSDPVHVLIAEKLVELETAARVAKNTAKGTRNVILSIAGVVGIILTMFTWIGVRGVGPGARADAIEAKVDRNFSYTLHNDSTKMRRDSIQDVSIARMLEGMTINAYQICMTQTHGDGPKCNQIMSHNYSQ